jgi:hypothetical protein
MTTDTDAFARLADLEHRQLDPIKALEAARDLRTLVGSAELDAVRHARRAGWTWGEIGESMGTSKQAAQQRFGLMIDLTDGAEVVEVHRDGCRCGMTAGCAAHLHAPRRPGCAHALDARNCAEPGGGCPDARDALR